MVRLFLAFFLSLLIFLGHPSSVWAGPLKPPTQEQIDLVKTNWEDFSFSDFGAIANSGSIPALGRAWKQGQAIADVLNLGDLESLKPEQFSFSQIADLGKLELGQVSLSQFPLINTQSIENLATIVPELENFPLQEIEPLKTLFLKGGFPEGAIDQQLSEVLKNFPTFGEQALSELPSDLLGQLNVTDIPNIGIPALEGFEGWEKQLISKIPGLENVPLGLFPNPLAAIGDVVARIDFIYGPAENKRVNTISGSYEVGFNANCPDDGQLTEPEDSPVKPAKCAYIELDDLENAGRKEQGTFEGKQWISGKYHEVEGGDGSLKWVDSVLFSPGYEPTGRHPFGPLFKQVIWEPDETKDETTSFIFFRFCAPAIGCTPYNQLQVPFLTYPINSPIFVGSVEEGSSGGPVEGDGSGPANGDGKDNGSGGNSQGTTKPNQPCATGTNDAALAEAIAAIESQGSGGYNAIGVNTCSGGLCGRALGRYQTMSYKESVVAAVSQKPGGRAWLDSINQGRQPTESEMMQFYPPQVQEQVFQQEISDLRSIASQQTDPNTGRPFSGTRLNERIAQMWFGGPGVPIDDSGSDALGGLSVKEYGEKAAQNLSANPKGNRQCNPSSAGTTTTGTGQPGQSTGQYINPAPGSTNLDNFGDDRGSHIHAGVDLAGEIGDPILAADGGKVVMNSTNPGGYGNFVVIEHSNGRLTLYGHLNSTNVEVGQQVRQGQQIAEMGNTGRSSGPHLHYEEIEGATPGNPFSGKPVKPSITP